MRAVFACVLMCVWVGVVCAGAIHSVVTRVAVAMPVLERSVAPTAVGPVDKAHHLQ